MVSEMVCALVESVGYTVVGDARNGREAVEMVRELKPDVVLMDVEMPEMDGIEATRRIQECCPTPVVILTAYETTDLVAKAGAAGAGAYLVKPPIASEIGRAITIAMARFDDMMALRRLNHRLREEIAERKRIEATLRASEERYRSLTEAALDAIISANTRGEITFWNDGAARIFGYTSEEALGQPLSLIMPRRYGERHQQFIDRLLAGGEPRVLGKMVEVEGRRKDGTEFPIELSLSSWQAGGETFFLAVIRDITERKRVEEELRRYAADLEMRNAELDAFAHTVAHDLKNPLAAILGFTALLQVRGEQAMSEQRRHTLLRWIKQNAMRMHNIIDELLLLASVRMAEQVTVEPLDMRTIIAEVRERLDYIIEEHGADLVVPETWPMAYGYGPWVEEVWANYISNAVKYGGRPPLIELGAEPLPPREGEGGTASGGFIRFWVQDNGDGIPPEEQGRLFAPFERLHQVRATGHGLGLSIVRRIVERLGGQVGVESEGLPGRGSRFWFTLPTAPPPPDS